MTTRIGEQRHIRIGILRVPLQNKRQFRRLRESLLQDPSEARHFWEEVGALRDEYQVLDTLPSSVFNVLPGCNGIGSSDSRRLLCVPGDEFQRFGPCIILQPVASETNEDAWTDRQLDALVECICIAIYARIPGTTLDPSIQPQAGTELLAIS